MNMIRTLSTAASLLLMTTSVLAQTGAGPLALQEKQVGATANDMAPISVQAKQAGSHGLEWPRRDSDNR